MVFILSFLSENTKYESLQFLSVFPIQLRSKYKKPIVSNNSLYFLKAKCTKNLSSINCTAFVKVEDHW